MVYSPAASISLAGSTCPFMAQKCSAFMSSLAAALTVALFARSSFTASYDDRLSGLSVFWYVCMAVKRENAKDHA